MVNITILLLIYDPIVRSVLKEILDREGFLVLATDDIGVAVDRMKESMPELLITGTYVTGLTGHDAAVYLRSKCPKMQVLIVGGLLDDDRLQNREALQGFAVFPPPYPAAALIKKVKDVLASAPG